MAGPRTLAPDELRFTCKAEACVCIEPADRAARPITFGQPRALEALELGLSIPSPGYNVFVTGLHGSGRMTTVEELLSTLAPSQKLCARDRAYVQNFDDPSRPRLLDFPAGGARRFRSAMNELIAAARSQIPELFDSDSYRAELERTTKASREAHDALFSTFTKKIEAEGFTLVSLANGQVSAMDIFVIADGGPLPLGQIESDEAAKERFKSALAKRRAVRNSPLSQEPSEEKKEVESEIARLEARYPVVADELSTTLRDARRILRKLASDLGDLEARRARQLVNALVEDTKSDFEGEPVHRHLDAVAEHMLFNLAPFRGEEEDEEEDAPKSTSLEGDEDAFRIYGVNVIHDASDVACAPIVVEGNPTFMHLFGAIERESKNEGADFMNIRAGAVLRADGGYLVMNARDLLLEAGVWRVLVRTLRSSTLEIQVPEPTLSFPPSALKPEPIPINVKVVLIGDEELYALLDALEEDFPKIFKIKAEFDSMVDNTPENVSGLVAALVRIEQREQLLEHEPRALARIVEHAVRRAGSQRKLSTRFGDLADVMREASHIARTGRSDAKAVTEADVQKAIRGRLRRHDLVDQRMGELLESNVLRVDTNGWRTGEVNGLAIIGSDPVPFGKPVRITASVGVGAHGVIDIEREAHLSGPIHTKSVLVLSGYLRRTYGRSRRLQITASIAFEQSYGEIEGDSASLAELYGVLSAIADAPIAQGIAVTGSIDQVGNVQAVGGLNEKIEGFFRLCRARGLAEQQGVIVPETSIDTLMLDDEVVGACRSGAFAVHAVRSVDDGIPLLFGIEADDLHRRVDARLEELSRAEIGGLVEKTNGAPGPREKRVPLRPEDPRPPSAGR
jgi:lon-related putative ATP-dependent protease